MDEGNSSNQITDCPVTRTNVLLIIRGQEAVSRLIPGGSFFCSQRLASEVCITCCNEIGLTFIGHGCMVSYITNEPCNLKG